MSQLYMNLIGILRWLCELGRVDILHETALLSQYMASPRIGHFHQVLNVFKYVKGHPNRNWLVMDPTDFDIEWKPMNDEVHPQERAEALNSMYPDATDEVPYNSPKPRGKGVNINAFVDSDHAGNKVTRRSHTGIMIYLNMAPISWFSKRQNTVETSTFGSEFIALRTATEMIDALRYKLRMLGVPIIGPARVFCDNQSVVKNSTFPELVLKKKHCSICYHKVRESVAAGKLLIYYENSASNIADLFTKVLPANKRESLIDGIMSGG